MLLEGKNRILLKMLLQALLYARFGHCNFIRTTLSELLYQTSTFDLWASPIIKDLFFLLLHRSPQIRIPYSFQPKRVGGGVQRSHNQSCRRRWEGCASERCRTRERSRRAERTQGIKKDRKIPSCHVLFSTFAPPIFVFTRSGTRICGNRRGCFPSIFWIHFNAGWSHIYPIFTLCVVCINNCMFLC